jgi:hypothetical protein
MSKQATTRIPVAALFTDDDEVEVIPDETYKDFLDTLMGWRRILSDPDARKTERWRQKELQQLTDSDILRTVEDAWKVLHDTSEVLPAQVLALVDQAGEEAVIAKLAGRQRKFDKEKSDERKQKSAERKQRKRKLQTAMENAKSTAEKALAHVRAALHAYQAAVYDVESFPPENHPLVLANLHPSNSPYAAHVHATSTSIGNVTAVLVAQVKALASLHLPVARTNAPVDGRTGAHGTKTGRPSADALRDTTRQLEHIFKHRCSQPLDLSREYFAAILHTAKLIENPDLCPRAAK